jgi:hypothetical protein
MEKDTQNAAQNAAQKIYNILEKSGEFDEIALFEKQGVIELGSSLHIKIKDIPHVEPPTTKSE